MTARFVTSAPTERAFAYKRGQSTWLRVQNRRGPIQPMNDNLVTMGRVWFWTQFVIYAGCVGYALDLWIVK